ncbi:hypothetical protein IE4771_PB00050 (plasmid) [Rhizobium etli bv. mimosae str. IE4771]|uniref:Uncharacterized protein n=1 Tax=Rhizobium etli bv. mimosae str. IE4771 TaxID=1432050 RepID=A0A060ICI7_RHIET|nr:hypothetical protein [Rhizobium sp. IE4771]AIC29785.1 hypothetical protein IE4771_PB00050 [Rhizobium sp. IE4771]
MTYDPSHYHIDARSLGSGLLLVAVILCGMALASLDPHGIVQASWSAMAGEMASVKVTQCS